MDHNVTAVLNKNSRFTTVSKIYMSVILVPYAPN